MTLSNKDIPDVPEITIKPTDLPLAAAHVAKCLEGIHEFNPTKNWKYGFMFRNEEAKDLIRAIEIVKSSLKDSKVKVYENNGRNYFQVHGAGDIRFIVYLVVGDM